MTDYNPQLIHLLPIDHGAEIASPESFRDRNDGIEKWRN